MPNTATTMREIALHVNRYAFAARFVKDRLVLDVACGSGYGSKYLDEKGARIVVSGDLDQHTTRCAKTYWRNDFVIRLDAQQMPFRDDCFDVIVSFETIEHVSRPDEFISKCRRVLKNGGLILCSTPNKQIVSPDRETPMNPYHTKEFSVQEFADLMRRNFEDIALYGQEPATHVDGTRAFHTLRNIVAQSITLFLGMKIIDNLPSRLSKIVFVLGLEQIYIRRLQEIKTLDNIICRRYLCFPLRGNLLPNPTYVIAVGKKSQDA